MLRSITFPMHTASENRYRRQHAMISARKTKKQREDVRLFLRQLPSTKLDIDGHPNRFEIRFVRIAVGELDYTNLVGAFKGIEDEVAAWIGLDDRDPRITSEWLQQPCKSGYDGVRIEIRDIEHGGDRIVVLGPSPPITGPPARNTGKGRPRKGSAPGTGAKPDKQRAETPAKSLTAPRPVAPPIERQAALRFVVAAAVLPWAQDGEELVLTELPALENVDPAPPRTFAKGPDGNRITITCRGKYRVDALGPAWIYAPENQPFEPDVWGLERIGT